MSGTGLRAVAILPARFASTRFPGKPLADKTGKPLIQHAWERAMAATSIGRAVIATDDERIMRAAERFGAEAVMTASDHPNGTSRIEEAVRILGVSNEVVVNVQGDEPTIDPALIDAAVAALGADREAVVATIASPFSPAESPDNPHIVKVVCDQRGRALYFSRSAIPFNRDGHPGATRPLKHVGLYAYRREFLPTYVGLSPTPLELSECLEQLRVLEHGYSMIVCVRQSHHHGIDTPEQYEEFVSAWNTRR